MTKREKQIGIGMLAALAAFGLDQWVVQPYWDTHTTLVAAISKAQSDIQDAHRLFNTERLEQPKWKAMIEAANGLKSERYAAESQAEKTVLQWATGLGVNINNLTTEGVPGDQFPRHRPGQHAGDLPNAQQPGDRPGAHPHQRYPDQLSA